MSLTKQQAQSSLTHAPLSLEGSKDLWEVVSGFMFHLWPLHVCVGSVSWAEKAIAWRIQTTAQPLTHGRSHDCPLPLLRSPMYVDLAHGFPAEGAYGVISPRPTLVIIRHFFNLYLLPLWTLCAYLCT